GRKSMPQPVYTLDEVAQHLHKSRRWLQDWLRAHPADRSGKPFYAPLGRTKTFDDSDIARIRAAANEDEQCRLNLSRPARERAQTGRSEGHTSASTWTKAAELTGDPSLSPNSSNWKKQ